MEVLFFKEATAAICTWYPLYTHTDFLAISEWQINTKNQYLAITITVSLVCFITHNTTDVWINICTAVKGLSTERKKKRERERDCGKFLVRETQ